MADFLIMSDLHTEHAAFEIEEPASPVDAVLLAGDLGKPGQMPEVMRAFRDRLGVPVYAVEGNHDLWRKGRALRTWEKIRAHTDAALAEMTRGGPEMRVLRRGAAAVVNGTRVIGATLWTDGQLGGDNPALIRDRLYSKMNDYRHMTYHDTRRGLWRKAIPEDLFVEHRQDLSAILTALDTPFDGPSVVMTHHVPLACLLRPVTSDDGTDLSAAYGSNLAGSVLHKEFAAWIYGHSHQGEDAMIPTPHGAARFVSNPRGYPHESLGFRPGKVLSVSGEAPAPSLA